MTNLLPAAEDCALAALAAPGDACAELRAALAPDHPLARLAEAFGLAPPEVSALLLLFAAGDSEPVARAAAAAETAAGGIAGPGLPVWLLARAVPGFEPAALGLDAPLRRFGMVEPLAPGAPRIEMRLRLAPALADMLAGLGGRDPGVAARVLPLEQPPEPGPLAEALAAGLAARGSQGLPPAIGAPGAPAARIAGALAALGLAAWRIEAADLPADPEERARLAGLLSRDAALARAALILEGRPPPGFVDRILGQIVLTADALPPPARGLHLLPPPRDDPAAARARWSDALGPARSARLGPGLGRIAAQFRLPPAEMATAIARAGAALDTPGAETALWRAAARAHADPQIAGARLVEPVFTWDDIVLAPAPEAALHRLESHVRHAALVLDDWGFAARTGWRGRGIAALFSGPPGTGKTMAAEVLASALGLRLLVVDLSQVISKWIGETSKNIAALFDFAAASGAAMVWNEGEAIWGARGGVNSATDRHVNAEVGDLLQRIEDFSGFTIVTTNLRSGIDPAFLRRFRFAVDFPAPAAEERLRLWSRAFPPAVPLDPIDWRVLSALPMSGGSIRNVALGAAFRAAAEGGAVSRAILAEEIAAELRKHNQPVPRIDWEKAA